MKFYGLRNKVFKTVLGMDYSWNPENTEGTDVSFEFHDVTPSISVWLVSDRATAERALTNRPAWYNAGAKSPEWPKSWKQSDYEVFEIEL